VLRRARISIVTHSELAATAFRRAGVPAQQVLVAHNGYAPALMEPRLDRDEARARLGLPLDKRLVVYTGHVGARKGTSMLLRIAERLREGVRVVMVGGEGTRGERGNVIFIPRVPLAEVAQYLYAADCLIVPPASAPLRRYGRTVLPMKIFSYLAAGRPIVAPRLPDIEEVLTHDETALLVGPDDEVEAADAIGRVLSDSTLRLRLAENARAAAARFTWQARAETIISFMTR
jgi:glycosyltransferase involved in cell wall biosynthesis